MTGRCAPPTVGHGVVSRLGFQKPTFLDLGLVWSATRSEALLNGPQMISCDSKNILGSIWVQLMLQTSILHRKPHQIHQNLPKFPYRPVGKVDPKSEKSQKLQSWWIEADLLRASRPLFCWSIASMDMFLVCFQTNFPRITSNPLKFHHFGGKNPENPRLRMVYNGVPL